MRLSEKIEKVVYTLDGISGKLNTLHQSDDFSKKVIKEPWKYFAKDVALVNASVFLEAASYGLEMLVAKPIYHTENLVAGKISAPGWIFSQ